MTNDAPFPHFRSLSRIGHNCQTVSKSERVLCETFFADTTRCVLVIQGKWLTLLKAQWSQNPDVYPHFTVRFVRTHSLQVYLKKLELPPVDR